MRVLAQCGGQTSPNRILENVAGNSFYVVLVAHDPFVIAFLPERPTECERLRRARTLLREFAKPSQISAVARSLDEKMDMVRHEAVRKNLEALVSGGTTHLRQRLVDPRSISKAAASLPR